MGQVELFQQLLYLKPFNFVQTNDEYQIDLLVLDSNVWNHFIVANRTIYVGYI